MEFLADEAAVDGFLSQHADWRAELEKSSGILHLQSFLPEATAEAVLAAVQALDDWEEARGTDDAGQGYADAIDHRFKLAELGSGEKGVRPSEPQRVLGLAGRLFWKFFGAGHDSQCATTGDAVPAYWTSLPNLTAACYAHRDFIAPHDDLVVEEYSLREAAQMWRLHGPAQGSPESYLDAVRAAYGGRSDGTASIATPFAWERQFAMVFYLNRGWKAKFGGEFQDLAADGRTSLPLFNSLVVFRVPRMHAVLPVRQAGLRRLSLFGWWLTPLSAAPKARARGKRRGKPTAKVDNSTTSASLPDGVHEVSLDALRLLQDEQAKASTRAGVGAQDEQQASASTGAGGGARKRDRGESADKPAKKKKPKMK